MTWAPRILAGLAGAALVSCAAPGHSASNISNGGSGAGQCNPPCVLFHVQIQFTGLDAIQGSFIDNSSGEGDSSCTDWAKGDSVGWILGPGAPSGANTPVIGGKSLNFGISVTKDRFHGPGTYSKVLLGGVTIGPDIFLGDDSTETLNADGSGHMSFSNLVGGSVTGPQGNESGTVTWTCSA
jgi:hypothetical protein